MAKASFLVFFIFVTAVVYFLYLAFGNNFSNSKLIDYGEDPNDPGGYFIINGSERVIVGLEDLSYNKIIVDRELVGGNTVFKAKVYSSIVGYRAKLELVMKKFNQVNMI